MLVVLLVVVVAVIQLSSAIATVPRLRWLLAAVVAVAQAPQERFAITVVAVALLVLLVAEAVQQPTVVRPVVAVRRAPVV